MRGLAAALLCWVAALAGCGHHDRAAYDAAGARYTVGPPWQGDGAWFYPREAAFYDSTGLAVVDSSAAHVTADGERYDPARATGASQTLQLPVMVRVENLQNGRAIAVRLNDRGPASPGRLLSVTPKAARLLGMAGQATEVRVTELQGASQALLVGLPGAPKPDVLAAPRVAVEEQDLMGHGGVVASAPEPERAPSFQRPTIANGPPHPGLLWIDVGQFSTPSVARTLAARIAGEARRLGRGRAVVFEVRAGPFDTVAAADAALDRARSAGVVGARIIVE
ncbi:septal ring lytic transglycosylase RlpA family protein [Lichenicoccus sp.]|uniref:septal ring lytic transglycosylase RlpA family protein n=1 Tax=Lichenicoccus sp. TaxID=2781899 RepID=UPI003D0EB036